MKARIAVLAACTVALVMTASLAHAQQIFDRWGRTETQGKKTMVVPTDSRERGYVGSANGGVWKQGTACGFKVCENESPRPSNR